MSNRTRNFDRRTLSLGRRYRLGTWFSENRWIGDYGDCSDDDAGWDGDNPLLINYRYRQCGFVDGQSPSGNTKAEHFILTHPGESACPSADSFFIEPNWADLAFDAAAHSNPQRPAINLPAFIGECGDIPSMFMDLPRRICDAGAGLMFRAGRPAIKPAAAIAGAIGDPNLGKRAKAIADAARRAASEAGSQYVGAQFGWKPLVGDLARMLGLQEAIRRQLEMLLALKQGRSIKRRMKLPTQSYTGTSSVISETGLAVMIHSQVTDVYRIYQWTTARWAPSVLTDYLIPDLSDAAGLCGLAMRLATGMTKMGVMQAWWELLPWSWLFDWWYNLGRLLAVLGNSLALTLASLCYMRTSLVTRYYAHVDIPSWLTRSGPPDELRHVRKYRKSLYSYLVLQPPPSLSIPLLSGRQMGILAGLLSQKQSRGL